MKKILSLMLAVLLVLSLAACGSAKSSYRDTAPMEAGYVGDWDAEAAVEAPMMSEEAAMTNGSGSAALELPQNRKWVITLNISAETEDMDQALEKLFERVSALGGYVENQEISNGGGSSYRRYRDADLTLRIPADHVEEFQQEIGGFTNVLTVSRNVKDITLSYTDTESRIKALRTEEERLLELMGMAETMSDLLEIEERLTYVRYELESYTSQLRKFDNQVDYATVSLYIKQVTQYTPPVERTFLQKIGDGFAENLSDLFDSLTELLIWLITGIPYFAFLGLIGWIVWRIIKACRKRSAAKKAERYQQWLAQQQPRSAEPVEEKTE